MNEIERSPLDGDLLRSFVAIAACGSLTAAAARLNRTQSAISVQLRRLETGLGVALFDRTPKGMVLTNAGENLLPRARSILADLRQVSALFTNPLTGSLRVGLPDDFDNGVLERVLTGFARAHPGVHVVATSGCTSHYPADIRNAALDIAVYSGPENDEGETLGIEETVWACKRDMRVSGRDPVPLAVLDRSCWWRDLPAAALDAIGREYEVAFRSSSFSSIQSAIRSGFAVGILPETCVTDEVTVLSRNDGFPELPRSRRSIMVAAGAPKALTAAMADAIRTARSEALAAQRA